MGKREKSLGTDSRQQKTDDAVKADFAAAALNPGTSPP
jgi:hypothetical protein